MNFQLSKPFTHSPAATWLAAIAFGSFLIRVVFILSVSVKPISGGDSRVYQETAHNIVAEGTHRSEEGYSRRPPLYSYFLALVYFVAQAFVGAAATVLLFKCLLRFGHRVAAIGALLFSFHPLMLFFTEQVLTESLFCFLLILLTYLALEMSDGKTKLAPFLGLTMGATILCRPEVSITCVLLIAGIFFAQSRRLSRTLIVVVIAAAATIAPWLIRNTLLLGRPVLSSNGGVNFYIGNNPESIGAYLEPKNLQGVPAGEAESDSFYLREGFRFIAEKPLVFAGLIFKKEIRVWSPNGNLVLDLADLILLPFLIFGVWMAWLDRPNWRTYYFFASPIAGLLITSSIFFGGPRFRAPDYPFFIVFVSLAANALFVFVDRTRHDQAVAPH